MGVEQLPQHSEQSNNCLSWGIRVKLYYMIAGWTCSVRGGGRGTAPTFSSAACAAVRNNSCRWRLQIQEGELLLAWWFLSSWGGKCGARCLRQYWTWCSSRRRWSTPRLTWRFTNISPFTNSSKRHSVSCRSESSKYELGCLSIDISKKEDKIKIRISYYNVRTGLVDLDGLCWFKQI